MNKLTIRPKSQFHGSEFFAVFICIGHESRCTHFASLKPPAKEKIAFIYDNDQSPRTTQNRKIISELGFVQLNSSECNLRQLIKDIVARCSHLEEPTRRIAVDISSMTRELMAIWVYTIMDAQNANSVEISFVYSHAKFSPPPEQVPLAKELHSITPEFAGMFSDSTAPVMLLIGLGYEPELALSFIEYLEPAKLLVFEPAHHEKSYTKSIHVKNAMFFKTIKNTPLIRYNVFAPYLLFQDLESAIQGAAYDHRVHIAPYGVKIFAIASLLAASLHYPKVFIWNLNTDPNGQEHDRVADGKISEIVAETGTV
jgi:hypothetical protein